jgi:hypothetical protein
LTLAGLPLAGGQVLELKEENMGYLVAAYAVLWAVSFGLVVSMVLRQRKLDSELQSLRVLVDDDTPLEGD